MAQSSLITPVSGRSGVQVGADIDAGLQAAATWMFGPTAPTNPLPGMAWLDTAATPWVLRLRNAANDAWIALIEIDDTDDKVRLVAKLLTMTGQILAAGGTLGAPGIAFSGDPDTGLYRIGANSLGLVANGALVFEIADGVARSATELQIDGVVQLGTEALTSAAAIALSMTGANKKTLSLAHNATITVSGEVPDQTVEVWITSTGSFTAAWSGVDKWIGGSAPTLSTTSGEIDIIVLESASDGSTIIGSHVGVAA